MRSGGGGSRPWRRCLEQVVEIVPQLLLRDRRDRGRRWLELGRRQGGRRSTRRCGRRFGSDHLTDFCQDLVHARLAATFSRHDPLTLRLACRTSRCRSGYGPTARRNHGQSRLTQRPAQPGILDIRRQEPVPVADGTCGSYFVGYFVGLCGCRSSPWKRCPWVVHRSRRSRRPSSWVIEMPHHFRRTSK